VRWCTNTATGAVRLAAGAQPGGPLDGERMGEDLGVRGTDPEVAVDEVLGDDRPLHGAASAVPASSAA
jgi:hypothetical protein